jgi:F-type H+-transporting ATPase subunit a
VFSSEKIREEEVNGEPERKTYQGEHYAYTAEKDKIKVVGGDGKIDEEATKKVWDFSITRNVASMWLGMLVLLVVFLSVSASYKKREGKAPKGLQSFLEPIILFVRDDVAIPNIGVKYTKYLSLLLTIFFFILINNLFGLIPFFPGGYNLTGNIAVTLTLATITLVVVNFSGNKYYWKHVFAPDIPLWLYIIMVPVEIIGIISKPFALMIRLFANITAGHIVVLSLVSLIFIFKSLWVSPASIVFVVFMDTIELLVAFLQAYIFTMLTALFIGLAVEEHHH